MSYTLSKPASTQAPAATETKLRLWPAVLIVAVEWLLITVPNWIWPGNMIVFLIAMWVPILATVGLMAWWVLGSRLGWADRWLGLFVFLAGGGAMFAFCHPTIRYPSIFFALPAVTAAWAGWLFVAAWLPWSVQRIGLVLALLLTWGYWAAVRFDGIYGDMEGQINWRWATTSDERRMAELNQETMSPTAQAEPVRLTPGDWPGFRGPARDGRLAGVRIATDWGQRPPKQLWKKLIGPGWSSMAVVAGRIYTQEQLGANEVVVCLDAETGKQLWSHSDETRFSEMVAGPGPRGTPTFHESRIYAQGANGVLNCLDAATGTKVWSADVAKDSGAKVPQWGFSSSPLVAAGLVSVFAGGPDGKAVVAYDANTGKLAWTAGKGTHGYCSTQLSTIAGVEQLVILSDLGAAGFDPASGKVLWEHEWCPREGAARCIQPAVLEGGDVLVGSGFGSGTRRLHLEPSASAWGVKEVWTTTAISPYYNDMVVHKGHIYGFDNMFFTCVNLDEGEKRWRTRGYGNGQVLLLADQGLLVVLSEKGEVVLLEATPEKHTVLGRFQAIKGKTWNHPVIAQGKLYVRNGDQIACYQLETEGKP